MFASIYNQIKNDRKCGDVTKTDLKNAGFNCGIKNTNDVSNYLPWAIFEWNAFQVSAENQIDKNNCLNEQMTALFNNDQLLHTWFSQLTASWMGMKKSDLILTQCYSKPRKTHSLEEFANYKQKKITQHDESLSEEWNNICSDSQKISALKAARSLFPYALPVVSDSNFFKTMAKYRKMIINKKTNKPISDEDLLKADLQDLSFMKLKIDPEFEREMKQNLSNLYSERSSITKQILDSKKNGSYELSDELKEYIFEDETVYQVLFDRNLMSVDYAGLDKTRSEINQNTREKNTEDFAKVPVSNGAFCILAKYEPTFTGEMIDFAMTSAIAGGILFKSLKGIKYLESLSTLKQIGRSTSLGFALNGYPMMAKQVYNSCGGNDAHTSKKVVSMAKTEVLASIQGADLPNEVGYGTWNLDIDPKITPSCNKIENKNLMLNKKYKSNCFLDSLLAISPLKISLPILIGISVSN
ncbi:MAG: hypothetical protein ACXVCN_18775 [Bdellovibrio sp.]